MLWKSEDRHPPRLVSSLAQPHANRFLNFNAGVGPVLDFILHCRRRGKDRENTFSHLEGQLRSRGKSFTSQIPCWVFPASKRWSIKSHVSVAVTFSKTQNLFQELRGIKCVSIRKPRGNFLIWAVVQEAFFSFIASSADQQWWIKWHLFLKKKKVLKPAFS